jgi:hypothetical protein
MNKQVRDFKIEHSLDWEYGVSIEQIEEDIKKLKSLGVTRIEIEAYNSYDCAYLSIETLQNRLETDDEYKDRIGKVKYREEAEKKRDLEQLARLKEKYKM